MIEILPVTQSKEVALVSKHTVSEESGIDFAQMEAESYVSLEEEVPRQPVAISIGSSVFKGNSYPIPFGSYGDYSCIVGSSKSKKTFLKSAIVSGYIGGDSVFYFENIRGHDNTGKYVIDIDTEQSRYHSQRVFRRVGDMVGKPYPYYKSYCLRQYSATQRLAFIDWLVYRSPFRKNIGLISIDGYADLIDDFNSLEQSNMLQAKLLTWTTHAKCHITGVLHKNHGTEKPVGHIGSAVLKKAETVVFTEAEPELTLVKCAYSRNMPFKDFKFEVDKDWLPREVSAF